MLAGMVLDLTKGKRQRKWVRELITYIENMDMITLEDTENMKDRAGFVYVGRANIVEPVVWFVVEVMKMIEYSCRYPEATTCQLVNRHLAKICKYAEVVGINADEMYALAIMMFT